MMTRPPAEVLACGGSILLAEQSVGHPDEQAVLPPRQCHAMGMADGAPPEIPGTCPELQLGFPRGILIIRSVMAMQMPRWFTVSAWPLRCIHARAARNSACFETIA